ncbi:MAG: TRL domain-containing protein [Bacteroidota bacterium]|nr:TRL domain-containing protein [Bacteroidota bacterium]
MKKIALFITVVVAFATTSCTKVYPGMVTTATIVKTGEAKKVVWFGIAKDVDVSIATAAKNGGITKVATVDYGYKWGLFKTTYFTRVTGE